MSAGSSSGSGRGGRRARGGDIIDLDRYMRGARPPRPHGWPLAESEGGSSGSQGSGAAPRAPPLPAKRPSHDSGLSESSYTPRRKPHAHTRRERAPSDTASRTQARAAGAELAHVRAACERTLRAKGEQVARVRRFYDHLDGRARDTSKHTMPVDRPSPGSEDSSNLSSTSSAHTPRHRDEFKTYKIIMTKLDELNRMFIARPPARPARPFPRRAPPASSSSASLSEQPALARLAARSSRHLASRRVPSSTKPLRSTPHGPTSHGSTAHGPTPYGAPPPASARLAPLRTLELSISPHEARPRRRHVQNVHLESVVKYDSSSVDTAILSVAPSQPRAESLQKRASNRSSTVPRLPATGATGATGVTGATVGGPRRGCSAARGLSLCGRCKGLWRALTGRSPAPERP